MSKFKNLTARLLTTFFIFSLTSINVQATSTQPNKENIKNEKEVFITKKQKLWIGTIIFCGVVLIILSMLTWTDVGSKLFQGVQGRYFLPILPLFLLLFRGKGIILEKHIPTMIAVTTVTATALAFLESFSYIIQR